MRLIHDFKHTDSYRKSFNRLALQTFGISFEEWYQRGYWDDRYICYAYVDCDEVVANVSVSRLQLLTEAAQLHACQIGTVMTHPNYRGQGLSAKLMDYVLQEHAPNTDIFYLFANRQVLDYYPRFGFHPAEERQFVWEPGGMKGSQTVADAAQTAWRQLDLHDARDERLLLDKLRSRQPVSRRLSVMQHEGIFLWHALQVFPRGLYYQEQADQIWACSQTDGTLHLYDCITSRTEEDSGANGSFPALFRQLCAQMPGIKRVVFSFTPDKLELPVYSTPVRDSDVLFVKRSRSSGNGFPQDLPFKYPVTAQA